MKTHIIRDTKTGIAGITSVFAKSMTTWALDYAREDKKARMDIALRAMKDEKKLIQKLQKQGLLPNNPTEAEVSAASAKLDGILTSLSASYDIDL